MPVHLRNAPTKLMKELGYGHEYRYAHDEPDAYAAGETYLPDGMRRAGLVSSRRRAGSKARSPRSWRGCGRWTRRAQREQATKG